MTRYLLIRPHAENPRDNFDIDGFTPWINCDNDDADMTLGLAVNKWLRDAGYQGPYYGEERPQVIDLDVWMYDEKIQRYPNGRPIAVNYYRVACTAKN